MSNSLFNFFNKEDKNLEEKTLVVNKLRCPQNHACPSIRVCPVGALYQNEFEAPKVYTDKCIKCGKCVKYCPMRALVLQ